MASPSKGDSSYCLAAPDDPCANKDYRFWNWNNKGSKRTENVFLHRLDSFYLFFFVTKKLVYEILLWCHVFVMQLKGQLDNWFVFAFFKKILFYLVPLLYVFFLLSYLSIILMYWILRKRQTYRIFHLPSLNCPVSVGVLGNNALFFAFFYKCMLFFTIVYHP